MVNLIVINKINSNYKIIQWKYKKKHEQVKEKLIKCVSGNYTDIK